MKKVLLTVAIMALSLALIMSFVGCTSPEQTVEKINEALKNDATYECLEQSITTDESVTRIRYVKDSCMEIISSDGTMDAITGAQKIGDKYYGYVYRNGEDADEITVKNEITVEEFNRRVGVGGINGFKEAFSVLKAQYDETNNTYYLDNGITRINVEYKKDSIILTTNNEGYTSTVIFHLDKKMAITDISDYEIGDIDY